MDPSRQRLPDPKCGLPTYVDVGWPTMGLLGQFYHGRRDGSTKRAGASSKLPAGAGQDFGDVVLNGPSFQQQGTGQYRLGRGSW